MSANRACSRLGIEFRACLGLFCSTFSSSSLNFAIQTGTAPRTLLLKKGGVEGPLHTFNGAPKGVLQKLHVFGGCSMVELVEQSWFWWSGAVPNKPLGLGCEAWILSIVLR